MSVPKCVNCRCPTKKISKANMMFLEKYLISDATFYLCKTCGEKYFYAEEYGRIMKKIDAIESKSKIPAVQEVIAKTKFLVL